MTPSSSPRRRHASIPPAATVTRKTRRARSTRKPSPTATGRALEIEDLARLVFVSDAQVSPDGRQMAFVRKHIGEKNEYVTNLWLADADGKRAARALTSGNKDHSPRWAPDGQRLAFVSGRSEPSPQVHVIELGGGEARTLTAFPEGDIASFRWSPDGRLLAVLFRERSTERTKAAGETRKEKGLSEPPLVVEDWWWRMDGDGVFGADRHRLYLVDTETGEHRLLYGKDRLGHGLAYDFAPDSKELVLVTNTHKDAATRPEAARLVRVSVQTGKVTPIPDIPAGVKTSVAWSPDGKRIAYAGYATTDAPWGVENMELLLTDARKGGCRRLTAATDWCLEAFTISDAAEISFDPRLFWTADGKRLITCVGWHGEQHVAAVDVAGTGKPRLLTSGQTVHDLCSLSADGRAAGLVVSDPVSMPEAAVARLSARAARSVTLTDFNRELLGELALSQPESHRVPSTDGTQVHTWVLRPPQTAHRVAGAARARRGRRPGVLEIHGGPHGQYGVGFFFELQLLAARGHVVVYSNPRGSKGYGRDHCAAIRGAWGDKDWDDIQAVSAFMAALPDVDTHRLGVMGGSYGGYMTNWAIGHTDMFRAAISDRCVTNLVTVLGNGDISEAPDSYWPGNTWNRTEALWDQSPQKWLDGVTTPTLIIHSEGDLRCNIEQSDQLFTALRQQHVPVRYVRYPADTSHGMSRAGPPDMRRHRLAEILSWWARWFG